MDPIINFLINFNEYTNNKKIICINKNLYIGGLLSTKFIDKYNIDIIINLNAETKNLHFHIPKIDIILPDKIKKTEVAEYKNKFQEIKSIINEFKSIGLNILVYCLSGISKSPAIIIYLLMKNKNDILSILKKLKKKNSWICPNKNYLQFLLLF